MKLLAKPTESSLINLELEVTITGTVREWRHVADSLAKAASYPEIALCDDIRQSIHSLFRQVSKTVSGMDGVGED